MNILQMIANDRNLLPEMAAVLAPPPRQYQAKLGWNRTFNSEADCQQYEAGYALWPTPMPPGIDLGTPCSAGWFDHEADFWSEI